MGIKKGIEAQEGTESREEEKEKNPAGVDVLVAPWVSY